MTTFDLKGFWCFDLAPHLGSQNTFPKNHWSAKSGLAGIRTFIGSMG